MSSSLYEQHCQPCMLGARPMSSDESNRMIASIPRWKKINVDGVDQIRREFHFRDFKEAFSFSTKVCMLAERENHHPSVLTEWGKVTVYWWTHKANGLHANDFIMAAKTDLIASKASES